MKYRSTREYFDVEKKRFLRDCTACGVCLDACQPYPYLKQAIGPTELLKEIAAFLGGGPFCRDVYEFAFSCSLCGCCEKVCPKDLNFMLLMDILKAELVDRGYRSPPSCAFFLPGERYNAARVFEALQVAPAERRWFTDMPVAPEPREVVFFLSCFFHQTSQDLFTALDILDRLGINYAALGGIDFCCGEMDLSVGNRDRSDRLARRLTEAILVFQPETVVFLCGGCYYRFKHHLPLFLELPFEIKPLSQFYLEHLDSIHLIRRVEERVTYHDPCGLGRRSGVFDAPRELIRKVPGIELVEMAQAREGSRCCGGMTMITNPPLASSLGEELGKAVAGTGSGKVITSCTGCHLTLKGLGARWKFSAETYISLLGRAMGIEREDRLSKYLGLGQIDAILEAARENIEQGPFTMEEMRRALSAFISDSGLKEEGVA